MVKQHKNRKNIILSIVLIVVVLVSWMSLTKAGAIPNVMNINFLCPENSDEDYYPIPHDNNPLYPGIAYKPVIYLYPTNTTSATVKLDYQGALTTTYPKYDDDIKGWNVTAYPDGRLINLADGKPYSYLFWEGISNKKINWDLSKGFVVKGSETREFLQEKLAQIGLTPQEYNEFIVYWYPLMQDSAYNLITFAGKQYTDSAQLTVTPTPDSVLRVFMVYKPLTKKIAVQAQPIEKFERKGFAVVEWGGTKIE